jgi:hypothetical protein
LTRKPFADDAIRSADGVCYIQVGHPSYFKLQQRGQVFAPEHPVTEATTAVEKRAIASPSTPKPPKAAKLEKQGVIQILEAPSPPLEHVDPPDTAPSSACSGGGLGVSSIVTTPCLSGFAAFGGLGMEGEATARFSAAVVASGDVVLSVSVGRFVRCPDSPRAWRCF